MAFNPRTDVILEVASAADPSRATLAAPRLNALDSSNAPSPDFAANLDQAASAANAPPPLLPGAADALSYLAAVPGGSDKLGQAKTQFEAMMLNSFVSEMLPKDTGEVFGQGTAGDMWRSMLADQVSTQIANRGRTRRAPVRHAGRPSSGASWREQGRGPACRPDERQYPISWWQRILRMARFCLPGVTDMNQMIRRRNLQSPPPRCRSSSVSSRPSTRGDRDSSRGGGQNEAYSLSKNQGLPEPIADPALAGQPGRTSARRAG
jgi:hypothetical protein